MQPLHIDREFENIIAAITPEEFSLLENNIKREGCLDPIRVWYDADGSPVIVDGHNRYKICKKWEIDFAIIPIPLPDREGALLWIEQNQLGRRNLTDEQRAIVAGRVASRLAEQRRKVAIETAREAKAAKRENTSVGNTALPTDATRKDRTAVEISKTSRVPLRKIRAAQKLDKTPEGRELATKVLNGEMPLAKATRQVKASASALPQDGEESRTLKQVENNLEKLQKCCLELGYAPAVICDLPDWNVELFVETIEDEAEELARIVADIKERVADRNRQSQLLAEIGATPSVEADASAAVN
jgi:hypothetical protein